MFMGSICLCPDVLWGVFDHVTMVVVGVDSAMRKGQERILRRN